LYLLAVVSPVQDLARDLVMAVGKYVGFHDYRFSHDAFDRKSPAIDLGPNALNYDAAPPIDLLFWHALVPPRRESSQLTVPLE
jgi:hypothetical protein